MMFNAAMKKQQVEKIRVLKALYSSSFNSPSCEQNTRFRLNNQYPTTSSSGAVENCNILKVPWLKRGLSLATGKTHSHVVEFHLTTPSAANQATTTEILLPLPISGIIHFTVY